MMNLTMNNRTENENKSLYGRAIEKELMNNVQKEMMYVQNNRAGLTEAFGAYTTEVLRQIDSKEIVLTNKLQEKFDIVEESKNVDVESLAVAVDFLTSLQVSGLINRTEAIKENDFKANRLMSFITWSAR